MSSSRDGGAGARRLEPGSLLGRYRILGLIGAGGMGEVYRAHDGELDREVAIKVLPEALAADPERLERFTHEARALARTASANVLQIFDFARYRGVSYAVTEILEGVDLRRHLAGRALPWREAVTIAAAALDGLAAAHRQGVLHRDLKPENLFRCADGTIKVLDFGIARIEDDPSSDEASGSATPVATAPGSVLGTVGYIAPEVLRGGRAEPRSDLFAMGCVLYEMVTGRRAFAGSSTLDTAAAILEREPVPPRRLASAVPQQLERIILRCLAKDPAQRFASAAELAAALRVVGEGGSARPVLSTRVAVVLATSVLALAVATAVWQLWGRRQPPTGDRGRPRAVVAVFSNHSNDRDLGLLGTIAAESIAQGLSLTGAADAVPGMAAISAFNGIAARLAEAPGLDPLAELARVTKSTVVVSGSIVPVGDRVEITAVVTDVIGPRTVAVVGPESGSFEDKMEVLERIRRRVMGAVAMEYGSDFDLSLLSRSPDFESTRELANGIRRFGEDYEAAMRHFRRALEIDAGNFGAAMWLVGALTNLGRLTEAEEIMAGVATGRTGWTDFERAVFARVRHQLEGDVQGALREARKEAELASADEVTVYLYAVAAISANRPGEALQALNRFEATVEMNTSVDFLWDVMRLKALHLLGRFDDELGRADAIAAERPELPFAHVSRVRALAGLGRTSEAPRVVDQMLAAGSTRQQNQHLGTVGGAMAEMAAELRTHGLAAQARQLAARSVAWFEGHPERRAAASRGPALVNGPVRALQLLEQWDECLAALDAAESQLGETDTAPRMRIMIRGECGAIAAWRGRGPEARAVLAWLAERNDDFIYGEDAYQSARIEALLGDSDTALDHLREAFASGLEMDLRIHHDPALEPLRVLPAYQELMRPR